MNSTLKRRKSISSQAASISAWCAVFDWLEHRGRVERVGATGRRAARRRGGRRRRAPPTACATSRASAAAAASIACFDLLGAALVDVGEHVLLVVRHHGLASSPVRRPRRRSRAGSRSARAPSASSAASSYARSGEPGARSPLTGSFRCGARREDAGAALIRGSCIRAMRLRRLSRRTSLGRGLAHVEQQHRTPPAMRRWLGSATAPWVVVRYERPTTSGRYRARRSTRRSPRTTPEAASGAPAATLPRNDVRGKTDGASCRTRSSSGSGRTSLAERDDVRRTFQLDADWTPPFQARSPEALRAVPRGEVVTYGELARARRPAWRGARGRHVLRRQPLLARSSRATASSRPAGSAATGRSASTTSGGCWRSRARSMSLSDELRDELAAIAPDARLRPARRALGALPLRRQPPPARARPLAVHLDLASLCGRPRAFTLLRELGVRSEIRTYRRRAFDRATRYQLHVDGDDRGARVAARGRRLSTRGRAARAAAAARRRPRLLPRRVPARRAARRRLALRAARAAPRARATGLDGAEFLADIAARDGVALRVARAAAHAVAYAKGTERSPTCSPSRARATRRCASTSAGRGRGTRAQANRLANADRREPRPHEPGGQEQLAGDRALSSRRSSASRRSSGDRRPPLRHPSLARASSRRSAVPPITKAAAHHRMVKRCKHLAPRCRIHSRAMRPLRSLDANRRSPLGDPGSERPTRRANGGPEGKLRGRPSPPPEPRSGPLATDGV